MRRHDGSGWTWADESIVLPVRPVGLGPLFNAAMDPPQESYVPPGARDSINASGQLLQEEFNNQIWIEESTDHIPTYVRYIDGSGRPKPDCVLAYVNWRDIGWMVATNYFLFAMNCLNVPLLPAPSRPGELPVFVIYANTDTIILRVFLDTMTYFYNHDQSQLFFAVLGHVFPNWYPFAGGQRKTSAPPTVIADDVLEDSARYLRQHIRRERLELAKAQVKGFYDIQRAFKITDLGFQEVVSTAVAVINKTLTQ
ncbi:uncharacterized protein EV420DRAFT_1491989 [Desarmillaria tabescens]|uniref:Uncharacterized protein n=1 Tax=Armillaria tabescens TaxID=1929756 RepID=A0AA39TX54_ARMTA|nr:uncharacterized protein EV420DRAFT_1491989 [Desarmillaria tabescens]KAK0469018.1 hypothetical protein EV420DRAFT_1491989 [Desarmillaria tabescens]